MASPTPDRVGSSPPTTASGPLLSVTGLTVRYGTTVTALREVTLDVAPGSITAVLGGNGAGKTTLMRTVSGTLSRHKGSVLAGDILLGGRSLLSVPPEKRTRLGVVQVPEGRRIFGRLTVLENLRVGRFGRGGAASPGDLDHVFELFPVLAERRKQRAALLSGGEQQMLAIGRGLMASPHLLLLDEPTLGLAPIIIEQITDLLKKIRDEGTTLLLVEQNAGVALDLADTAYVFNVGAVALSGSAAELRADERVQRLYLGGDVDDVDAATSGEAER